MFTAYCPGHRNHVLLFTENIDELLNHPDGVEIHWHCTCGTAGTKLIRRSPRALKDAA